MVNKKWILKEIKRRGGIILGNTWKFVCKSWGKLLSSSGWGAFFRSEIWIHDFPNMKWELSPQCLELRNILMSILERQVLVHRCIIYVIHTRRWCLLGTRWMRVRKVLLLPILTAFAQWPHSLHTTRNAWYFQSVCSSRTATISCREQSPSPHGA